MRVPDRAVAAALAALLVAASITIGFGAPSAVADDNLQLTAKASSNVLAGEHAGITLTATNVSSEPYFNAAFRYELPVGVVYVPGSTTPDTIGDPAVYTITTTIDSGPPPVTQTHQVLIWQNVSDLPPGADFGLGFEVDPDPELYPVGSQFTGLADAYASSNPRLLAKFDADGDPLIPIPETLATAHALANDTTSSAIAIAKSEGSPEGELMRGVHTQTTTYTLTVFNTTIAATNDITVVDYLPAGLEFLGCGGVDNSAEEEYPGSGPLDAPVLADCVVPDEVATVLDPPGMADGVYTRVTWSVGTMAGGSSPFVIRYQAGIPLHANTMTWPSGEPSAASLEQGSNLDNNTGASTRQIDAGIALENSATATGIYSGPLASGASPDVADTADVTVTASDLSVVKSASRTQFVSGETVEFSLELRAGEYATVGDMVITDTFPAGLCPLLPEPVEYVVDGVIPPDCTGTGQIIGATLQSVTVHPDESYTIVLTPAALDIDGIATVTYTALMRSTYDNNVDLPTAAGDSFRNEVDIEGTTTTRLAADDEPLQTPDDEHVIDDSSAGLSSAPPAIQKSILPRTDLGSAPCPTTTYVDLAGDAAPDFRLGDRMCFELVVDFSDSAETRNAELTDFVPVGTTFDPVHTVVAPGSTVPAEQVQYVAGSGDDNAPTWLLGAPTPAGRYVAKGAVLVMHVSAIVTSVSPTTEVDITANLMKYRQESTAGAVLALRDQVDFGIAPPPVVALSKGADTVQTFETDVVTYTLEAANHGSAEAGNDFTILDTEVWDALPPGIRCADVSAISTDGTCEDDFAGFSGAEAGRSGIVWVIPAIAAGDAGELTYDVTMPAGISVSTSLTNTASIVQLQVSDTAGGRATYWPADSLDRSVTPNLPGANATATVSVTFADAAVTKTGTTSINETNNNTPNQAVAGELVNYSYTVTVPPHTSVFNAVLSDTMHAHIPLGSAIVTADLPGQPGLTPGTMPVGWTLSASGTLTFPAFYDNTSGSAQTFTVHITGARVLDTASTGNKVNTASFASTAGATGPAVTARTATYTINIREPQANLEKSASTAEVTAGQVVTYTLKAWDTAGRPPLHSGEIVDCLPAGLAFGEFGTLPSGVTTSGPVVGNGSNGCAVGTMRISWTLPTLQPAVAPVDDADKTIVTFTATIDPAAAGLESYLNTARLTGSTIDGGGKSFSATANATVTVASVPTTKTVEKSAATIGESNSYTITTTIPADINVYDAAIIDTLPVNLTAGTAGITCLTDALIDCMADLPGGGAPMTSAAGPSSSTYLGWFLGDVTSRPYPRTVTITLPVVVADVPANGIGTVITNTARLSWFPTNQPSEPANAGIDFPRDGGAGTVTFRATGPQLFTGKSVTDTTPEPGQTFGYHVFVSASGVAYTSNAYDVVVTDVVPEGVIVDGTTISDGGVLSGATATGGGTITWNLTDVVMPGSIMALSYSAELAASDTLDGTGLLNTADITSYRSLPGAGRTYDDVTPATATVVPQFPRIGMTKTPESPAIAYVDDDFGWQLRLTNGGGGAAAQLSVTDQLPANWVYLTGSARVSIGGATATTIDPTATIDETTGVQILVWADLGAVASGAVVAIDYRAVPLPGALIDPGVGRTSPHVNSITAVAEDATGATGNADAEYAQGDASATAYIDSADLSILKAPADALVAGETNAAWTITVSNLGPDAAVGTADAPFRVTDVPGSLPTGVVVQSASGTGWSCSAPDELGAFDCTRIGSLASGASFPAISVIVTVPSTTPIGTEFSNTATVQAHTHDPDDENNTSTSSVQTVTEADLAVDKVLNGTAHAGEPVSWTIAVTNLGPSTSAGPIVLTDTLPAGITGATGTGWDCTVVSSTMTCTHAGDVPVGPAGAIIVSAVIDPGFTGDIVNTATITSRTTPDPNPTNDTDTVTSAVDTATTLTLGKALVGVLEPGSPATYQFTVRNTGTADARDLVFTDPLPAGLSYLAGSVTSSDAWTCSGTTTAVCSLATPLAAGGETVFSIQASVPSGLDEPVDNTATVVADNAPEAQGSALDPTTPRANYGITKTHPSGTVFAGQSVDYTIVATNLGPSDDPGTVTVADTLPAGMTATAASGTDWDCTVTASLVTCTYPLGLVSGASAPAITLTAAIAPSAGPATLVNTATVTGSLPTDDTSRATVTDPVVVTDHSDVSITKTVTSGATVRAGESVTYELSVINAGPSDADSLVVTDALPAGMTAASMSGAGWTCVLDSLSCSRATLAPGSSTITVVATVSSAVPDATVLTNTATVAWLDGVTPRTGSDTADVTVVAEADLALTKTADDAVATAGETTTFTLSVQNLGPSDAVAPLTIVDTLPAGLSYLGASAAWSCSAELQVVACTLEAGLAAGASAPGLVLTAVVDPAQPAGDVVNTATVSSTTVDPVPVNNTATATVTIALSADLAIVKTHVGPVAIGNELDFTLAVRNEGPSQATAVRVVDVLPVGLAFVDADLSDDDWVCEAAQPTEDGTVVTCELGVPLAPDTDAPSLVLTTVVGVAAYPEIQNTATVTSAVTDPVPDNNSSTDEVVVPPQVDLTLSKTHLGEVRIGKEATYLLTVHNAGPTEDPGGFTVTDELPAGLTFVRSDGEDVTCEPEEKNVVVCTFDDAIPVDGERTVRLVVSVHPGEAATIANTAMVASLYTDLSTNSFAEDEATVLPALPVTGAESGHLLLLAALLMLLGLPFVLVRRARLGPAPRVR